MKCISYSKSCMDRRKSSRQKRKTIVRNNFYLFGKAMSAEPGLVVLSALMRVVVSVRTSFLRVIYSDVYRNLVFDRRSHLCGSELF